MNEIIDEKYKQYLKWATHVKIGGEFKYVFANEEKHCCIGLDGCVSNKSNPTDLTYFIELPYPVESIDFKCDKVISAEVLDGEVLFYLDSHDIGFINLSKSEVKMILHRLENEVKEK